MSSDSPPRGGVILVCSPGGHLGQMLELRSAWEGLDPVWVTLPAADTRALLASEEVIFAHGPTNRSLRKLVRNAFLAVRTVRRHRPRAILSTGAALAVPFFLAGRVFGARLVYVESLTRVDQLSLSGRLVYPLCHDFFVQWPNTTARRRARYVGKVID